MNSDFLSVELSAAGVAFAGEGGVVRISAAHFSYSFAAGKPVRVLTSEWSRTLVKEMHDGQPLLKVAETPSPSGVAALAAPKALTQKTAPEPEIAEEEGKH